MLLWRKPGRSVWFSLIFNGLLSGHSCRPFLPDLSKYGTLHMGNSNIRMVKLRCSVCWHLDQSWCSRLTSTPLLCWSLSQRVRKSRDAGAWAFVCFYRQYTIIHWQKKELVSVEQNDGRNVRDRVSFWDKLQSIALRYWRRALGKRCSLTFKIHNSHNIVYLCVCIVFGRLFYCSPVTWTWTEPDHYGYTTAQHRM